MILALLTIDFLNNLQALLAAMRSQAHFGSQVSELPFVFVFFVYFFSVKSGPALTFSPWQFFCLFVCFLYFVISGCLWVMLHWAPCTLLNRALKRLRVCAKGCVWVCVFVSVRESLCVRTLCVKEKDDLVKWELDWVILTSIMLLLLIWFSVIYCEFFRDRRWILLPDSTFDFNATGFMFEWLDFSWLLCWIMFYVLKIEGTTTLVNTYLTRTF